MSKELEQARLFLDRLHTRGAWAFLWKPNTKRGHLTHWYQVSEKMPFPKTFDNVYFGVNPCAAIPPTNSKGQPAKKCYIRSQIPFIQGQNCLYSEFDIGKDYDSKPAILAHLDSLPLAPSVVIDSGNGYHTYFLFSEFYEFGTANIDREWARLRQAAWVQFTGGDYGAHCITRVLRLPGTLNVKYEPARRVTFSKFDLDLCYDWLEIDRLLDDIMTRMRSEKTQADRRGGGPNLDGQHLARYAKAAIVGILDKVQAADVGNRNSLLHWGACRLGELAASDWSGLDRSQAVDLLLRVSPLPENESKATIESGLSEGGKNPAVRPQAESMQERVRRMYQ